MDELKLRKEIADHITPTLQKYSDVPLGEMSNDILDLFVAWEKKKTK